MRAGTVSPFFLRSAKFDPFFPHTISNFHSPKSLKWEKRNLIIHLHGTAAAVPQKLDVLCKMRIAYAKAFRHVWKWKNHSSLLIYSYEIFNSINL